MAGDHLVTGRTPCPGFPTTPGFYDATHSGMNNVFVAKLDSSGTTLIWSTYWGGIGNGLALDQTGQAVVVGEAGALGFCTYMGGDDLGGKLVRRLLEATLPRGDHPIQWDRIDDTGRMLASGQYFARLTLDSGAQVRKMAMVR